VVVFQRDISFRQMKIAAFYARLRRVGDRELPERQIRHYMALTLNHVIRISHACGSLEQKAQRNLPERNFVVLSKIGCKCFISRPHALHRARMPPIWAIFVLSVAASKGFAIRQSAPACVASNTQRGSLLADIKIKGIVLVSRRRRT
jgi:hypothetical protein